MNVEIEVPKDHLVPKKWTYFICHLVPDIFRTIVRNALSRLAADIEETAVTDAAVIICQSSQFSLYSYMQSSDHDVSIVTPLWGLYSLLNEDLQPLHYYSANPQMLFSGMCFDIFHLDNCSMTDFYASVILFFGGRIAVASTEFTTHRILELQPSKRKHPLTQIDISLSELSLMSFNSATVSLFVNYFFQLAGKGDSSKVTVRDERGFLSIEGCATRTVSFSWLDACITQRCILPETDFYTSSKHAQGRQFQPPRKVSDTPEKEFVERTNFSQPLKESYIIVCQRIRKRIAEVN